ncbi:Crp/Fnr family transcriptional regulator [Paenibacillus sp. NPDC056579]|uniref:Crp/Fnr family transcriptional regulator n=1 Tax=Paenibacillus sp. NPDC056579 TaxID=3345871 RepID=UPI0036BA79B5
MDKLKYLSRIHLFRHLDREELSRLEPVTPMQRIPKGTLIAAPHEENKLLFLIKSGTVRLYRVTESGKELTVDLLGAGHLFGEIGSFTTGSGGFYAETAEDSVICTIGKGQFEQLITERPQLALTFIEIVSSRLKEVEELLEQMAYGSVKRRLLFLLQKLSDKFGSEPGTGEEEHGWVELNVTLTQQELATMTGSIRETVADLLNGLASEGIVKKAGQRKPLRIHAERLSAALQCCK